MKLNVCDVCYSEGIIVKSKYHMHMRGKTDISIDLCEKHKNTPPKNNIEFVKFVYKICHEMTKLSAFTKKLIC
jgi:hypothetical protein